MWFKKKITIIKTIKLSGRNCMRVFFTHCARWWISTLRRLMNFHTLVQLLKAEYTLVSLVESSPIFMVLQRIWHPQRDTVSLLARDLKLELICCCQALPCREYPLHLLNFGNVSQCKQQFNAKVWSSLFSNQSAHLFLWGVGHHSVLPSHLVLRSALLQGITHLLFNWPQPVI